MSVMDTLVLIGPSSSSIASAKGIPQTNSSSMTEITSPTRIPSAWALVCACTLLMLNPPDTAFTVIPGTASLGAISTSRSIARKTLSLPLFVMRAIVNSHKDPLAPEKASTAECHGIPMRIVSSMMEITSLSSSSESEAVVPFLISVTCSPPPLCALVQIPRLANFERKGSGTSLKSRTRSKVTRRAAPSCRRDNVTSTLVPTSPCNRPRISLASIPATNSSSTIEIVSPT
mmetsp:Transcript_41993/g.67511  ORF Transcript_41993/g.67511 Transcript_41993/m.67511 type:complete len:231 (-) Transcript_41993:1682-2374(-)